MTRRMFWNSSLFFWSSNLFNLIRKGMASLPYIYMLQAKFEEPKNRNKGGRSNKWSADHTRTDGIFWFKYFSIFILLFVETKSYLAVRTEKVTNVRKLLAKSPRTGADISRPWQRASEEGKVRVSHTEPTAVPGEGRACQDPAPRKMLCSFSPTAQRHQIFFFLSPRKNANYLPLLRILS